MNDYNNIKARALSHKEDCNAENKMKNNFTSTENSIINNMSDSQLQQRSRLQQLIESNPYPSEEINDCIPIFLGRQYIQRLLFLQEIYSNIVSLHGVIMEFGVRWGVNLANLVNLRSIYEPYNPTRKIIGFDTFEGFPSVSIQDGDGSSIEVGSHTVSQNYERFLDEVLALHEQDAPINHIKKFEVVKGRAPFTVSKYIEDNPETLIALAYFDFDLYQPTKEVLIEILPRMVRGGIIAFDELNYHRYPGETTAFLEVLGAQGSRLIRSHLSGTVSYIVWEGHAKD